MNEKIILVDDDNHILTSVSVALRNEGWQVETYPDGEKGLIALQRNIPDLVILDIKMPRIDGMEMLKRLWHGDVKKIENKFKCSCNFSYK